MSQFVNSVDSQPWGTTGVQPASWVICAQSEPESFPPPTHLALPTSLLPLRRDTQRLRLCKVAGCTFVNQYLVIKYLGRGSCGRVFLCMNTEDRQLYAIKVGAASQLA